MPPQGIALELSIEPRLCYAMQQNAVPWLRSVRLQNGGEATIADLEVVVEFEPAFAPPLSLRVDALPGGEAVALTADPRLDVALLANQLEGVRAEVRAVARRGEEELAAAAATIDLLAYNEWPGLAPLPPLLAAFVSPNHPGLAPMLHAVSERLRRATGDGALDGYQQKDPGRTRAMLAAVHEALRAQAITYVSPPPSFERRGQKVRTPEQVLGDRLGTCLDLALLYAALLEHAGLHPLVVMQRGHAFVGVWLQDGSTDEAEVGPAVELRKRCDLGVLEVVECTLCCESAAGPFAAARKAAREKLDDDAEFVVAVDVQAARRAGIRPLPPRTSAFVIGEELSAAAPVVARIEPGAPPARATDVEGDAGDERGAAVERPQDRLEHWKGKLLDLTLWNRLLNFRETKKTVRLCAHDLGALEDRLQTGVRMRILPRPTLGQGDDPRDLALAERRTGIDLVDEYLREELGAGRLRAELDAAELDARLVQIYRHARTTLEESGANTLYLAVGFLRWFESGGSNKERRAPLLLLPLVIERRSVQEGFRVLLDDAEPRVNQTLLQMLHRDFELDVPIEVVPEDERGVDVAAVLDIFRVAVLGMPRWEIEATAQIGFFSFTKYLMWLDLADRDGLLRSPVLRHLVETPGAGFAQTVPEPAREQLDALDPAGIHCPKDADSSQLAAVLAGAQGRTFVLEGPPGTGKSQTIANLIAQALGDGKRVLFVAEKRAALEVVQRRLDGVGLGPFCLELHSSKSGPKAVLEQLRRPLELAVRREPAEWAQLARELQDERARLNRYVEAVHRRREHGTSVHAAIGRLVHLRDAPTVPMPELLQGAPDDVAAARSAVNDLAAAAAQLGVPQQEPWWGTRRADWSPALLRDVVPAARRLREAAVTLAGAAQALAEALGLDAACGEAGPSRAQCELLTALAARFRAASLPPAALLRDANWRGLEAELTALCATGRRRDALWRPLAARWQRELLRQDLGTLAARYRRWADTFFVLRWWSLRGARRAVSAFALGPLGPALAVRDDLERALQVRLEHEKLVVTDAVRAALGPAFVDEVAAFAVDWDRLETWLGWVRDVRRLLVKLTPGALAPDARALAAIGEQLDGLAEGADALTGVLAAYRVENDEYSTALGEARTLLELDLDEAFGAADAGGYLPSVGERAARWLEAVPRLPEHCAYAGAAAAAGRFGAGPLVAAHAAGRVDSAALPAAFERTFLEAWLDRVHAAEPELAMFRGSAHERTIERFGALDRRAIGLAAEVITARLAARLPQLRDTQVQSSELGILARELKKQRRHKPVRRLLAETSGLLTRLAPCVLMSPLSVAQFLGRSELRFDLVVFDEASQIPMWDAVGTIGRGDSLVVVGDSRQLPPTSFFQRMDQGDDVEEDEVPDDLESVLDECGAAGLPRMHLDWHYRSRHESLIAFSNRHYYDDRLLTFPAPQRVTAGLGVRLVHVDGVYDRGGTQQNRLEAEALVADVLARLADPARCERSLGIVTFSRAQQVLIEDLLDQARAARPELERFFGAVEETVFVKNLENVQGDERDTILFSICYGPDADGKVYENYGPLNQQGGERRLNVAVTRARRELVVYSSVRPDQVANRTAAIGARHLRAFLEHAAREGQLPEDRASTVAHGDGHEALESAVRAALEQRGHEVHAAVGCSGYRLDLCVVDPDDPGRYLLGIECDGAAYRSGATARDRDRTRPGVLQGLGWRLHHVWSPDFWQDPDGEIARIEAAITAARQALAAPPVEGVVPVDTGAGAAAAEVEEVAAGAPDDLGDETGDEMADEVADDEAGRVPFATAAGEPAHATTSPADPDGPRPFVAATLVFVDDPEGFHADANRRALTRGIMQVLEQEGPVVFDRLARIVARAWNVARLTARARSRIQDALPAGLVEDDDALYPSGAARDAFAGFRVPAGDGPHERDADELPRIEVTNAARWVLRQHHALSAEDLARETARCFGITRLGAVVRAAMDAGIARLVARGDAVRDGDHVRLSAG